LGKNELFEVFIIKQFKMKKNIQEQAVQQLPNLVGKTVRFYKGFEQRENQIAGIFRVDKVSKRSERNVDVDITDTKNGKKLRFFIPCGFVNDNIPELKGLMDITGNFKESELRFYNLQFVESLKPWCVAPKVDFASTGAQSSKPMAEGKKVVRLTESDLVRLVKRILSEQ
jgi:hypothetical protein